MIKKNEERDIQNSNTFKNKVIGIITGTDNVLFSFSTLAREVLFDKRCKDWPHQVIGIGLGSFYIKVKIQQLSHTFHGNLDEYKTVG